MRGLSENVSVPDIFCSGLGAVERLEGNCLRLYFYASQAAEDGGDIRNKMIVAKLVLPASAVPDALLRVIAAAAGDGAAQIIPLVQMIH